MADLDGVVVGRAGASGVGTGGMQTKVEAARIATGAGIPVVLTSADQAADALAGAPVGTLFHATGRRRPTRLLWLAHATEAKGRIAPRRGRGPRAHRAARVAAAGRHHRRRRHASSPATRSTWSAPDGVAVARGLVNYDADELPALLGRSTRDLARELGAAYEREVVHRDDLVVPRPLNRSNVRPSRFRRFVGAPAPRRLPARLCCRRTPARGR